LFPSFIFFYRFSITILLYTHDKSGGAGTNLKVGAHVRRKATEKIFCIAHPVHFLKCRLRGRAQHVVRAHSSLFMLKTGKFIAKAAAFNIDFYF